MGRVWSGSQHRSSHGQRPAERTPDPKREIEMILEIGGAGADDPHHILAPHLDQSAG
ncbi:hypothetical protein CHKEEEPN_4436 [Methylorubrum podarium]|nr:hypothetical protein CHKEEEPN_4436 [Methylorubrum podarium]